MILIRAQIDGLRQATYNARVVDECAPVRLNTKIRYRIFSQQFRRFRTHLFAAPSPAAGRRSRRVTMRDAERGGCGLPLLLLCCALHECVTAPRAQTGAAAESEAHHGGLGDTVIMNVCAYMAAVCTHTHTQNTCEYDITSSSSASSHIAQLAIVSLSLALAPSTKLSAHVWEFVARVVGDDATGALSPNERNECFLKAGVSACACASVCCETRSFAPISIS